MIYLKQIPGKVSKFFKQFLTYRILSIIRKKRLGRNSHDFHSFEITTLEQHIDFEKPSQTLLTLISEISGDYATFDYRPPARLNPKWDNYNYAYIGEHYRLLPIIVNKIKAKKVVEIGTFKGASAEAILKNTNAQVISYDLFSCKNFKDCYISNEYLNDRFIERIGDLYQPQHLETLRNDLKDTSLIFLDGPKDFYFEKYVFQNLFSMSFDHDVWLVIDDIRVSTMVNLWHSIPYPKADISFLGHWSGTGLVYIPRRS